ncbi:MAG TPA: tetratricopeptide repeat protein [Candidatus Aquilonibacter sp.]|nr:tetratricopeptide repeat protein [Candidatus Aquilonibacter sp.]
MPQHIPRKQLKKDEVRETLAHGADALLSHQQLTLYIVVAAVVVALAVFGWKTYTERQTVKASAGFDAAMTVFQAPVGTPPTPGETSYSSADQKYTLAALQFADVASKYPRTHAGQLARYYAALSYEKIGKTDEAQKSLEDLANSDDQEVAALAKLELAGIDDRAGRDDEAVKLYEGLIAKPSVLVPKPVAMMALAEHYGQKNPAEAAKLYAQIKSEYPDTPIAEQADQALALLSTKS